MAAYGEMREKRRAQRSKMTIGDPKASSEAILKVVNAENPPLRLLLGRFATQLIPDFYARRLQVWDEWKDVAIAADGA